MASQNFIDRIAKLYYPALLGTGQIGWLITVINFALIARLSLLQYFTLSIFVAIPIGIGLIAFFYMVGWAALHSHFFDTYNKLTSESNPVLTDIHKKLDKIQEDLNDIKKKGL